jgi:hypothetical protein
VQRDSEKRGNPEISNPGFITGRTDRVGATGAESCGATRVGVTGVEPSDATGVDSGEADPFASDRLPVSGANRRNTTSLSASATPSYMDRQSQFWIDPGLVLVSTLGLADGAGQCRRFGACADAKFGQQAVHVILDCMNRDAQLRRDILVRQAQFQHPQDLVLARRKN